MATLNTINELRTWSSAVPADNFIIDVKGYNTAGDGGGGNFFWDISSKSLPDDGWDVIQINNQSPITGRWRRLLQDCSSLNIKYFGPRATNTAGLLETINDTDLINRAISCLSRDWIYLANVATTGNVTRSGNFPIDGETNIIGLRVLVKNQDTPSQNGIYFVPDATNSWIRVADFNTGYKMLQSAIPVLSGTTNGNKIFGCTNTITPIVDTDPINFAKLNNWIQDIKVATISNRTLSNLGAIDGIGLASGDRVLVMNQTNPIENGIYVADSTGTPWKRAEDFSPTPEIISSVISGNNGLTFNKYKFICSNPYPPVIGTDPVTFDIFKGYVGVVAATTGNITLSGEQIIDGVGVTSGKNVLVKNQTNANDNGVYTVATGAWSRHTNYSSWQNVVSVNVDVDLGGFINSGLLFIATNTVFPVPSPIPTVGTFSIQFKQTNKPVEALKRGGTLLFPNGKYKINSTIKITENVLLKGMDFLPVNGPTAQFDTADPYALLLAKKIALFSVEITTNKETTPAFRFKSNVGMSGFTFYYPLQKNTLATGESPVEYDFTISSESFWDNPQTVINDNLFLENLFLINPYRGINLVDAGRFNLRNIYGQPIETGIQINKILDVCRGQNIHFWPFLYKAGGMPEWIKNNGTAFKIGRIDGLEAMDWFAFGYWKSFHFAETNYVVASTLNTAPQYNTTNFSPTSQLTFSLTSNPTQNRFIKKNCAVVVRKQTSILSSLIPPSASSIALHTLTSASVVNIIVQTGLSNLVGITVFVELTTNTNMGFTAIVQSYTSGTGVIELQNLTNINGSGTFNNWQIRENKYFQASVVADFSPSANATLSISNINNVTGIGTGMETIHNWEITAMPGACWGTFTACNVDQGTIPILVERINTVEFLGGSFISNKYENPIVTTGKSVTVEPTFAARNEDVIKFIGTNFYGGQSVDVLITSADGRFVFDSCFFKDGRQYPENGYNFAPLISTSSAIVSISNCTGFETIVPFGANGVSIDAQSLFRRDFDVTPNNFGMNGLPSIPPTGWILGSANTASYISQLVNTQNGNGMKIKLSTQTGPFIYGLLYPFGTLGNDSNLVQENGLYVVEFDYQSNIPKSIDTTSTSSITVSASITITIGINLSIAANEPVTCLKAGDSTKKVLGIVSNYTAATGVLIIANPTATFTGTLAGNWTVSIAISGGFYTNFKVARDIGSEISINYGEIGALATNGNVYKIRLPFFLGAASPNPLAFCIGWTTFGNIVGEINITNLKIYKQNRKFTTNDQASGILKRIFQDPLGNGITHSVAGGKVINYGLSMPNQAPSHTGAWKIGDIVYAVGPAAGSSIGWVCTGVGATPTFKTFGAISV